MFRPRIIPCLLLKDKGLVKTIQFKRPTYVGDPINAVKIFNDLETDELIFLDITATQEDRLVPLDVVQKIGDEAFMPFAVGGGVRTVEDMRCILMAGAEKVVLNSAAVLTPNLIRKAADMFGSQSIIVSIDVMKNLFGKNVVCIKDGKEKTKLDPVTHAIRITELGAGEIIINSIDRDGMQAGYDLDLVRSVSQAVKIPVIALGGGGSESHLVEAIREGRASAAAAGSLFVFHGSRRAVLINYPDQQELVKLFQ